MHPSKPYQSHIEARRAPATSALRRWRVGRELFGSYNRHCYGEDEILMPIISTFYDVIVYMFFYDNKKHHLPHIHDEYAEHTAVISIAEGNLLTEDCLAKR
jgi:hypothetical protein